MKNIFSKNIIIAFVLSLFLSTNLFAVSETQIKAVFLEKFTHLIKWPSGTDNEFTICVIDDKNFYKAIKNIYKDKQVNNLDVNIVLLKSSDHIPECELLYIGKNAKRVKKLIEKVKNKPTLTVSDDKNFIDKNVMITIFLLKNKFKYIINNTEAKNSKIKISYLLLKSAQEVIK